MLKIVLNIIISVILIYFVFRYSNFEFLNYGAGETTGAAGATPLLSLPIKIMISAFWGLFSPVGRASAEVAPSVVARFLAASLAPSVKATTIVLS